MSHIVNGADGDTLCGIAIDNGFLNCDPLRAEAANSGLLNRALAAGDVVTVPDLRAKDFSRATERRHRFVKRTAPPVSVRFVHGSPDKKYLEDVTLTVLNVSNYVTDKGGLQGNLVFPNSFGFNQAGHEDADSFKVEVVDPAASGSVNAVVEALRPVLRADGSIDHHTAFAGVPDANDRKIDPLECKQVKTGHVAFRSRYLRLVVDSVDKAALPNQTVMVSDAVNAGDLAVEILDQNVQATYVLQRCNARAPQFRCQVTANVPLERGRSMSLSIHVLRPAASGVVERTPGGPGDNGAVTLATIKQRVDTFVRRYWAQAHVRPKMVTLETVDLPSNMITIADATGLPAKGNRAGAVTPGQIGFTIRVQRFGGGANSVHPIPAFNVPAGSTPTQTANLVKAAVEAIPGLTATPSPNSPETGDPDGSCDVLLSVAGGGRITVTNMIAAASQDEDQKVAAVSVGMTVPFRNSFANYHVGHPEQRNLVKALDTGDNVLDIHVVNVVPGVRGFTVPEHKHVNANRQPVSGLRNTIIMPVISTDASANNPFSFPHEMGHIMTDNGLHSTVNTELMKSGTDGASTAITDSKRIVEHAPNADNWETFVQNADGSVAQGPLRANATEIVNTVSGHLLT